MTEKKYMNICAGSVETLENWILDVKAIYDEEFHHEDGPQAEVYRPINNDELVEVN